MELFKKKFRVEIHHHSEGKYMVAYAHYGLIPNWRYLHFWFDQGHPGGTECWSRDLFSLQEAEQIASKLKSIEDVNEYYKPFLEEAKRWKEAEKRWWENHVPYSRKRIL